MKPAAFDPKPDGWAQAWPDGLAFVGGLAVAGFSGWNTTDLVWSLWLASLVVGFASILWSLFSPGILVGVAAGRDGAFARSQSAGAVLITVGTLWSGALVMAAFFAVHFGLFHYVHSVFLQTFFPMVAAGGANLQPSAELYRTVAGNYWAFLPVAFLAERAAFSLTPSATPDPPDTSVKAADIAARKARNRERGGMTGVMGPYKNVVRLHLLIFFFAFAKFAALENFFVYAVVYATYFFPWRLWRKSTTPTG